MGFKVIRHEALDWATRPTEPGEPERHTAQLSELAGFENSRANLWRYEPGAKGRRHKHPIQEETFVVVSGTLTMYLGDPPEREEVGQGGLIHVEAGTPLQIKNEGGEELLLYIHGWPPESEHAEILDSVV